MKNYLSLAKSLITLPRTVSYPPRHIQFDVTTQCNLNCRMCYAKRVVNAKERQKSLTFEQFRTVFEAARPMSVNLAASGEPLLNPALYDIIRYARDNRSQVIVSTNFTTATPDSIKRIVTSGIDVLKISVDGATSRVYEQIRGPHFEKLTQNLSALKKTLAENPVRGFSPRIDFVIMKTNVRDITTILEFARHYNIRHLFYRICDPRSWDEKDKSALLEGSFAEVHAQLAEAERLAKRHRITTNLRELLANVDTWRFIYEDVSPEGKEAVLRKPVCLLPWLQMFVSVLGDTSYCCSIYPSRDQNLGNVFDSDMDSLWNSAGWQKTRELFRQKRNYELFEGCKYCMPMTRRYLYSLLSVFPGYLKKIAGGRS